MMMDKYNIPYVKTFEYTNLATKIICLSTLALPMYSELTFNEQQGIIQIIKENRL